MKKILIMLLTAGAIAMASGGVAAQGGGAAHGDAASAAPAAGASWRAGASARWGKPMAAAPRKVAQKFRHKPS